MAFDFTIFRKVFSVQEKPPTALVQQKWDLQREIPPPEKEQSGATIASISSPVLAWQWVWEICGGSLMLPTNMAAELF